MQVNRVLNNDWGKQILLITNNLGKQIVGFLVKEKVLKTQIIYFLR